MLSSEIIVDFNDIPIQKSQLSRSTYSLDWAYKPVYTDAFKPVCDILGATYISDAVIDSSYIMTF